MRTQYLSFLEGLPPAFDEQRRQAATDTADWLKRHEEMIQEWLNTQRN